MKNFSWPVIIENKRYNPNLTKFQCYLFYFFMFSIMGWILELLYGLIVFKHFENRGFCYGPLCPIYGFGSLFLILFLDRYKKQPIKLFVYTIILFSIFEYTISFCLDALYNLWLWDYHTDFLNLNGRICLFYSVSWGIIALMFTYILFPFLNKFFAFISSKINTKLQIWFLRLLSMIFIIDILYSFIEYSSL